MAIIKTDKIRNVAVIAHVDHGKTTLIDAFLKQSHLFRDNQNEMTQDRILDSNELEKEKGITITAKNTAIKYKDIKINIIDTPGHADFSGEVERTLNMAEGCLLIVDAQEGVKPQTKFVLKKALELDLKPIVVINKIDKAFANPEKTLNDVSDLFLGLVTDTDQLDFPVFYAIGREGKVFTELPNGDLTKAQSTTGDVTPLLDKIIEEIPSPRVESDKPFQMQVCSLDFDKHLGIFAIGKVCKGVLQEGDKIIILRNVNQEVKKINQEVRKILVKDGLDYIESSKISSGDIIAIAGMDEAKIGDTLTVSGQEEVLPTIEITPPALKIKIEANTSPFLGNEGEFVNMKQLQQRLEYEKKQNIGLEITNADGGYFVAGRGELQLAVLLETLRREGYELQVRKPEIILKKEDGIIKEPQEEVFIEADQQYMGVITSILSDRKAEMIDLKTEGDRNQFTYHVLTRNMIGLRNNLVLATKGDFVMHNFLHQYIPRVNQEKIERKGVIISSETGVATGYSLNSIQERGELFIKPGADVYEGMIIGINKYDKDLEVNPTKGREQSNVRMKSDEVTQVSLKPTKSLTIEYALAFLGSDEMLEVTPKNLRLRKIFLKAHERKWAKKDNLSPLAKERLGL